jgi:hypothetical protein
MQELLVGKHLVRVQEDTVFLTVHGQMILDETITIHEHIERILSQLHRVFIVVDNREGAGNSPDARRWIGEWNKRHKANGVAIFGSTGATSRALIALVFAVIRIFRKDSLPLVFVKDEAEARAWVSSERSKLAASPSESSAR